MSHGDAEPFWDGLQLNPRSPVPLWAQLGREVRRVIAESKLPVGEPLPSEPWMLSRYGLSRNTVRQAYRELVGIGQIEARRGVGHYVAQEVEVHYVTVLPGSRITAAPPPDVSDAPDLPWWVVVTLRLEAPGMEPIYFDGARTVLLVS